MTVRRVPIPYSAIQDAIGDAEPGDTILVACGLYTGPVTVNVPRLRIEGESPSCTILQGMGSDEGFNVLAGFVTITGFTVRNFGIGIDVGDAFCTIRGNRVLDCNETGIVVREEGALVLGNVIANCPTGIMPTESDMYLVGNRIRNTSAAGINASVGEVLILQNRLVGCDVGIAVSGNDYWIYNNVVRDTVVNAIDADGEHHQVYGNVCIGSGVNGLRLQGNGHVVVFNRFINSRGSDTSDGIDCTATDCIFYGNEMVRNRQAGFNGHDASVRNTLLANKLENNATGILLNQAALYRVLSNTVRANSDTGINVVEDMNRSVLEDNRVTANRGNGLSIPNNATTDNAIRRNRLCGNRPFDIEVELPALGQDNTFDLNICNRSNPSDLCSRGC